MRKYFTTKTLSIIFILGLSGVMGACSSTYPMEVLVTKPALFELPNDIKRILLVNRSKGNATTVIEGVLSGEMVGIDAVLSDQCMSGLFQTLSTDRDLTISRYEQRLDSDKGLSNSFGNPIPQQDINTLASQYQADAVLALEFFDSDFSVKDMPEYQNLADVYIKGYARTNAGFRLYHIPTQSILYEKGYEYEKNYMEYADTKEQAMAKMIRGTDALHNLSYKTGQSFARRLIQYAIWEDRYMYKGKKNFEMVRGERYVLANNWDKGVEAWLVAYQTTNDFEEKGKIAYNLALGYEVLGDLEEAKKWITISYVDYGDKLAQEYAYIINKRIENEAILEQQNDN